jgi:NAD(P)-dependent dehydrogenase (short-subunit alcohol dehydrogenase family)
MIAELAAGESKDRLLHGKVALVTGASRNLGPVIVTELASAGAAIALNCLPSDEEEGRRVTEELAAKGYEVDVFPADVSQSAQVREMGEAVLDRFGHIDILVHCAGPWCDTPFVELPEADWDRIMDTNLKGAYLTSQIAGPGMKERGWGRIVVISAGSAFIRTHSVYGLAKAAIIHFVESLAVQVAPEVTANAIAPGQIAETTEIFEIDPTFVERAMNYTPLRRLVTRKEIAQMILLICTSPAMNSITGHTFAMDGGWSLHKF